MSHIIKSNNDLNNILNQMDLIRKHGINQEMLEELLNNMLPKEPNSNIKYKILENISEPAYFKLPEEVIYLRVKIDMWVRKYIDKIMLRYQKCSFEDLHAYVIVYVLSHEIEHANQYLIGKNIFNIPYQIIINCYNQLFDLAINSNIKNTIQKLFYWLDLKL